MHQQPVVLDHGTKFEENPFSDHGGMCDDGQTGRQTDRWTGPGSILSDSAIAEQGIYIKNYSERNEYIS